MLGRRGPDARGGIEEVVRDVTSPMKRHRLWRLPVIRGVIALGESLAIGFRALAISANVAAREEDDDGNVVTEISRGQIIFSFAIAIGFALMLFKIGPALLTSWLPVEDTGWFVVVEGLIRVAVFIAYIGLIGLLPDLRRVFQYHGAEHKTINALEAGSELSPEQRAEIQFDPPALRYSLFALGHGDRRSSSSRSSGGPSGTGSSRAASSCCP